MSENDKGQDRDSYSDQPRGFETRAEREFEIGKDEAWFANVKRTYDEFQDLQLTKARNAETVSHRTDQQGITHDGNLHNLATQALQNAIETQNMVAKQAVRHGDLSIDHQWNLEPSEAAAEATVLPAATIEALRTLMVESVGQAVKQAVAEVQKK